MQRLRSNKFKSDLESERMKELLSDRRYNPYEPYPPLSIPFQDLFRFWWNRCVERDLVADEILEDIFGYFREKMRPPQEEPEQMDLIVNFGQLAFFIPDKEKAA